MKKKICFMILSFLVLISFCSCSNTDKIQSNQNSTEQSTNSDNSYKSQMDIAMKHINNPKKLAKVNSTDITQVDIDLYSIGGDSNTIDDVIEYYIVADYAEKNSLKLDDWSQNLYDSVYNEMVDDSELTEEYCLNNYGISKNEVIKYAQKRIYQIGMKHAFSSMVTNEVSNGDTPKKHPELKTAYEKFEKEKLKNGAKAWEEIEQAYYEMIAKDYNIVIY
ncbi:MAG: hypothetical protein ACLSVW_07370 [Eubacterium sp.]|uniref:hypothetical protein n=1 Tax=Eubacterium sp. TaxID=142586 RepID=UPI003A31DE09